MKKLLTWSEILSFIACLSFVSYYGYRFFSPFNYGAEQEKIEIKIKPGMTLKAIADSLGKKGIIKNKNDFIWLNKLFRNVNRLKAGKYDIPRGLSLFKVMKIIVSGKTTSIHVVIPEGLISAQIASILQKKAAVDSIKFMKLLHDAAIINQFGIKSSSLEGYLFPNTYNFHWGITEPEIANILINEFKRNFSDSLKHLAASKGWSVNQILTLASIIEGEAMIDSERAIISAVYHNRLQKRMLLQADPTIQYIIPDGPRRLLKKDLAIDSPYNTYLYMGLPPGPVNNPGIKSILAAIHPAEVDYLYFVAKGDGSHIFSKTLAQHLKAKQSFDKFRKIVYQKQRMNAPKSK